MSTKPQQNGSAGSSNAAASNAGSDFYSATTRISKAVSATASALIESTNTNDLLLSNSQYKKIMTDTVVPRANSTSITKFQSAGASSSAKYNSTNLFNSKYETSDYYKEALSSSKAVYKVLTHIPDELLNDIPAAKSAPSTSTRAITNNETNENINEAPQFSLFQGFKATLPTINDEVKQEKEHLMKNLITNGGNNDNAPNDDDDEEYNFKLPNNITRDKIQSSYSSKKLSGYKKCIIENLDSLEVRKNLAASEIAEIDNKIKSLKEFRNMVFKRVAKLEQNEFFLESYLNEIEDKIQLIKEYDIEKSDESDQEADGANKAETKEEEAPEKTQESKEQDGPLLSKSIYKKIQEKPPIFKKKNHLGNSNRKTTPTLQQYYEPGTCIKTIVAHEDEISCFDFDFPFGTMVSASVDNTVKIWDLSKGKQTGTLEGHNAAVSCMQMEDSMVVTGSLDATLKLWDLSKDFDETGDGDDNVGNAHPDYTVHTFESHIQEITALSFHNYNLVSGSQDKTIRQWDLQTGHCLQTIDVLWAAQLNQSTALDTSLMSLSTSMGTSATTTPFIGALQTYDAALATGSSDGIVRLWDLRSGEVVRTLVGHTGPVTSLQFDDKHLTTGSLDRSIRIWDLRTGGIFDAFAYESPITSLKFDSRRIVSSNNEPTVKIYDRIEEKHSFVGDKEDTSIVNYVRYKEGYLVEGRANGKIGVWAV